MKTVFDFSIFSNDHYNPLWGIGGVPEPGGFESDFQTPDPDLEHPRPYLLVPENFSPTQIDFLTGSSKIGSISVGVVDMPTDPADQSSGIVTSKIEQTVGRRAILRRWDPDDEAWRTVWDGIVNSYSVDSGDLVIYWFALQDARERERDQPLFYSNFVLLGAAGSSGPAINYAALPGGGYLIPAVEPLAGTFENYTIIPGDGAINWGVVPISASLFANLLDLGNPVPSADGNWYYRDVWIRWRPEGGDEDDWVTLRDMPTFAAGAMAPSNVIMRPGVGLAGLGADAFWTQPTVYFGSFTAADIPANGAEIEFQILAANITEGTPFFWDNGTFGNLLREIYDGEHSPPDFEPIEYNEAAMAAMEAATPATHFILTEPVADMRKWVERNIYQPTFYAPAFDDEMYVAPVSGAFPADPGAIPTLATNSIRPVGDWQHGGENVVNSVEFTYQRESIKDQETTKREKGRKYGFFGPKQYESIEATLTQFERLFTTPVIVPEQDDASIARFGLKPLELAPVTVRAIGDVDGRPLSGDTSDETGAQLAARISRSLLGRFANGAPVYEAEANYSDPVVKNALLGDWLLVRLPYMPGYSSGRRGAYRYMQIVAINDEDPAVRRFTLVDSGVSDPSSDPDIVGAEDCLTGGTVVRMPSGRMGRLFTADGELVNTCDHDVTLKRLLLIAGGGGGGSGAGGAGGGGGAGGVIALEDVVIGAGETIPVHVGSGGAASANGEDSVLWLAGDGTALDPGTDPEPAAYHALGGGEGGGPGDVGTSGGSGGGAGAAYPISGGSSDPGGSGTAGQGSAGGSGEGSGGTSTCQGAGAGGGGSYAGGGGDGDAAQTEFIQPIGGEGGPSQYLPAFGVTLGGGGSGAAGVQAGAGECDPFFTPGLPGSGVGAGGGGSFGGGSSGIVLVEYVGTAPPALAPPTVSSTTVEDDGRVTVCVDEADWALVALPGYRVRVDYALGALEPDATSGAWRTAGYLDAPGCVTTATVPTGATVWSRAIAEATGAPPSAPSTAGSEATPETPGLLAYALAIDEDGVATVTWTPNAFAGSIAITGLIHDADVDPVDLERPLPAIDDETAATGTYTLPGVVPQGWSYAVDLEAWESLGVGAGRIYRLSEQRPVQILATRGPAIEWGAPDALAGTPSVADPLWGWYSTGDGATLQSDDDATVLTYAALDASAGTLLIGGAGVALTVASPTVTGTLTLAAGVVGAAPLIVPHGTAPTGGALVDGALWSEAAGWFARTTGVTQQFVTQPIGAGSLTLNASTTGAASLVMPPGAAPTGGALIDGAVWMVNATGWFGRRNGATEQFQIGTVGPTQGGTGITTYAAGDLIYASATDVLAALPKSATASGPILRQASGTPSWTTAIYPNAATAGALMYAIAANQWASLQGFSSTNQLLIHDGSMPAWVANLPYQRLPTGTFTWNIGGGTITMPAMIAGDTFKIVGSVGFFNTAVQTKKTVSGARNNPEAALASLLTQLAAYGLIADSTTAT